MKLEFDARSEAKGGQQEMLEQLCRNILESTDIQSLTNDEKERLLVLLAHDLGMGAKEGRSKWVTDLLETEPMSLKTKGTFSLLGKTERIDSFDQAVLHNAMAITASIREDFVAGTHPGAIIFPLLIAEAERSSKGTDQFLTAAAMGLKLHLAINAVFGKPFAQKGYRATAVIGAMAGAAALAMLRNGSADEAMKAMSVAASAGQGFAYSFLDGAEEWIVQAPLAALIASAACRNARSLHTAQERFLTGERSLSQLLDCDACREAQVGEEALSLLQIGVKRHPVNSFVQPVVEAVLRLPRMELADIERIVVTVPESFAAMGTLPNPGPFPKPNLALLSIPGSTALALRNGGIRFEDFRSANDPELLQLAQKVKIIYSADLNGYEVRVAISSNGEERTAEVDTAFFYPSLAEELEWVRNEYSEPIPWLERLVSENSID